MFTRARQLLELVRFSHTVFALPLDQMESILKKYNRLSR